MPHGTYLRWIESSSAYLCGWAITPTCRVDSHGQVHGTVARSTTKSRKLTEHFVFGMLVGLLTWAMASLYLRVASSHSHL